MGEAVKVVDPNIKNLAMIFFVQRNRFQSNFILLVFMSILFIVIIMLNLHNYLWSCPSVLVTT